MCQWYKRNYLHLRQCPANSSQNSPFLAQIVSIQTIHDQKNRLVLCDIRLMAISSSQEFGVSIRSRKISSLDTTLQRGMSQDDATLGLEGGIWPTK